MRLTAVAALGSDGAAVGTNITFSSSDSRFANAPPTHLLAVCPDRSIWRAIASCKTDVIKEIKYFTKTELLRDYE